MTPADLRALPRLPLHDPAACEPPGRLSRCRCQCAPCQRIRAAVDRARNP